MNQLTFEETSAMTKTLAVVGLITLAAILIPTVVLLISSVPDIARYIRMQRM